MKHQDVKKDVTLNVTHKQAQERLSKAQRSRNADVLATRRPQSAVRRHSEAQRGTLSQESRLSSGSLMSLTFNYRQVEKSSAPLMVQVAELVELLSNIYPVTIGCQDEAEPRLT